jgi:hypothetical protein
VWPATAPLLLCLSASLSTHPPHHLYNRPTAQPPHTHTQVHISNSATQSDGISPFYLGTLPGSSVAGSGYPVGSVITEAPARLVRAFHRNHLNPKP